MYRQQAQRLAEKLRGERPDLCVEVYQDGGRSCHWLVNIYDPVSTRTLAFESETEATVGVGTLQPRL